jgi:hypothetical protein
MMRWSVGIWAVAVGLAVGAGCASRVRLPHEPEGNRATAGAGELRMQDEIALNHRLLGLAMPHDLASLLLAECGVSYRVRESGPE